MKRAEQRYGETKAVEERPVTEKRKTKCPGKQAQRQPGTLFCAVRWTQSVATGAENHLNSMCFRLKKKPFNEVDQGLN